MNKQQTPTFIAATPVLPSLDIVRTVTFFRDTLGFDEVHAVAREYAIVERGAVELHFWFTEDAALPKASSCRVQVSGIDALYTRCQQADIVHPNASLAEKPWGTREFAILDPDGNLLTFYESTADR